MCLASLYNDFSEDKQNALFPNINLYPIFKQIKRDDEILHETSLIHNATTFDGKTLSKYLIVLLT